MPIRVGDSAHTAEHGLGVLVPSPQPPGLQEQPHLPGQRQRGALVHHVVAVRTDESVVFGVQHGRQQHGELGVLREVLNAGDPLAVQPLGAAEFLGDGGGHRLRELQALDVLEVDAVVGERLAGQIDPVAVENVLTDIANEVGHLERLAQGDGVGNGSLAVVGFDDSGHHHANGRGGAAHVLLEFGVGVIAFLVDVGLHRVDEEVDLAIGDVVLVCQVAEGTEHGVVRLTLAESLRTQLFQTAGLLLGGVLGVGVIDDLVGDPEEGVQNVRRVANSLGEQSGGEVEGPTGAPLDGLASLDLVRVNHRWGLPYRHRVVARSSLDRTRSSALTVHTPGDSDRAHRLDRQVGAEPVSGRQRRADGPCR